jgi:hypothetical protein
MMVTKLEHARAFKQMQMPLNTPVEQRTFSAEYTRHWFHLMAVHYEFMQAVNEYTTGTRRWITRQMEADAAQASRAHAGIRPVRSVSR